MNPSAQAPLCARCASPWFEPENGTLRCCACGLEMNPWGSRPGPVHTVQQAVQAVATDAD